MIAALRASERGPCFIASLKFSQVLCMLGVCLMHIIIFKGNALNNFISFIEPTQLSKTMRFAYLYQAKFVLGRLRLNFV